MQKRRRRKAGFTLFEVMITIALIALISGGVALGLYKYSIEGKVKATRTQAGVVRTVVKSHRIDSPVDCPSFETLCEDGLLDEASPRRDPWGNPWLISCDGAKVSVRTNGPDGQPGTEDDIRVPQE